MAIQKNIAKCVGARLVKRYAHAHKGIHQDIEIYTYIFMYNALSLQRMEIMLKDSEFRNVFLVALVPPVESLRGKALGCRVRALVRVGGSWT